MLQDKIHYISLLKYAFWLYENQKPRNEKNCKLNCNNNISSKYNQNTMFPVKCVTPDLSVCPIHLHLRKPCYHALAAWKSSFSLRLYSFTLLNIFLYISTTEKKIIYSTRLYTLEGHLFIQEINIKLKAVVVNNKMKQKKWPKTIKGSLFIKFIKQDNTTNIIPK